MNRFIRLILGKSIGYPFYDNILPVATTYEDYITNKRFPFFYVFGKK